MTNAALSGKPYAGNPHVRFDGGKVASTLLGPLFAAVAAAVTSVAFADEPLIVTSPTEITQPTVTGYIDIESDLAVSAMVSNSNVQANFLGSNSVASLTIENGGRFRLNQEARSTLSVGGAGGYGTITLEPSSVQQSFANRGDAGFYAGTVILQKDLPAVPGGDVFDFITLGGKTTFATGQILNNSTNQPIRVNFDGGRLGMSYNYASDGLFKDGGKGLIARGINGNPISIYLNYTSTVLSYGKFRTEGDCDFIFSGDGERFPDNWILQEGANGSYQAKSPAAKNNPNLPKLFLNRTDCSYEWHHSGDFRIQKNAWVRLCGDDTLPYGPQTGIIRLEGAPGNGRNFLSITNMGCRLDFNGYSAKVNGIISVGNVTNFAQNVTSRITFGEQDVDGCLDAVIGGNITVVKTGSGTLYVTNAVIPRVFEIDAGTVTVRARDGAVQRLGDVRLAAGATLVIDGAKAVCSGFSRHGTISLVNGGTLEMAKDSENDEVVHLASEWDACPVHVKAGTLSYCGKACTNDFWRLTVKSGGFGATFAMMTTADALTQCVYPTETSLTANLTVAPNNTKTETTNDGKLTNFYYTAGIAARDLQPGEMTFGPNVKWKEGVNGRRWKVNGLFDSSFTQDFEFTSWANVNNSATWGVFTFRLRAGQRDPAVSYLWAACQWGGFTYADWTLETSPTGEDGTWSVVDERNGSTYYTAPATWPSGSGWWTHDAVPFTFDSPTFKGVGGIGIAASTSVKVDDGAVLDLTCVEAQAPLANLVVDAAAGAGTIRGASLAASGTLTVENAGALVYVNGVATLPLVIDGIGADRALNGWTLRFGSSPTANRLAVGGGRLTVLKPGLMLSFR